MKKNLLHQYCMLVVLAVLVLICSGGLVTSKGAGLAVPDWPTTYGYNMFLFPVSRWVGGILQEHVHRLIASTVGLLTIALAALLWKIDPRKWVRWLGLGAVFTVILQGVLGGLRVTLLKDQIGIFHACLAQNFLLLCAFLALIISGWWRRVDLRRDAAARFSRAALFLTLILLLQMAIAATMRHAHAGLSIPDFPSAYGKIVPPMDAASVQTINAQRAAAGQPATAAFLIGLQFLHRLLAYFLAAALPVFAWKVVKAKSVLQPLALLWSGLVFVQIALGAWTIWSNKAADVATAHVATGAIMYLLGGLIVAICYRAKWDRKHAEQARNAAALVEKKTILAESH